MMSRIEELEKNVAELADIIRKMTWGQHEVMHRAIEVAKRTKQAVKSAEEKPRFIRVNPNGRKFR